jgi:hypothetical protein
MNCESRRLAAWRVSVMVALACAIACGGGGGGGGKGFTIVATFHESGTAPAETVFRDRGYLVSSPSSCNPNW